MTKKIVSAFEKKVNMVIPFFGFIWYNKKEKHS